MEKLDKLFRDKLAKHQERPTSRAWDEIEGRLAGKRRREWTKRLAIAASIVLFATAGFIGYLSLDNLTLKKDEFVVDNLGAKNSEAVQSSVRAEEATPNNTQNAEDNFGDNISDVDSEREKEAVEVASVENLAKEAIKPFSGEKNGEEKSKRSHSIAEANSTEPKTEKTVEAKQPLEENEKLIEGHEPANQIAEVLPLKSELSEQAPAIEAKTKETKTYAPVRIVYKANDDSELITSREKALINKGIDKLAKFSDEKLLTPDRKTKLRNTKEDLLALNFGKLLNKSKKEFNN